MGKGKVAFKGDGIIIFQEVSHAIQAEKLIRKHGYEVKLISPPPELRMGCDLALEINLVESHGIERILKEDNTAFVSLNPLMKGTADLCEIVKTTDYGQWVMVKAGNMKITFDKNSGLVVNVSGGGCPDIPYLHAEMVDKRLDEAPKPKELGYTLCAVMLDLAFQESLRLWNGGNN
ncbi:MAG: DUF3343 domain-containing protein [Dehalococcoidia bacterium]|nr:MAG: DUF3343 domain-containing protein [Dehalococcoidia bacterium]